MVQLACSRFNCLQNPPANAAASELGQDEHALDLAYTGFQHAERSASDRPAVNPRNKKCEIGIRHILSAKALSCLQCRVTPEKVLIELLDEILCLRASTEISSYYASGLF